VDHFKSINDRYGHDVGDEVLRQFAGRVHEAMRDTDLLFRWGGEEFVVLLPHTGPAEARPMAERIRATVAERPFRGRGTHPALSVTVSIGIAGSIDHQESAEAMVARADAACYRAKAQGRDRIEASTGSA
jgi:diguanylate cyclase (GGDEF)-like protein